MTTKLLGQFLLEGGLITREQLLHALKEQRDSSPWIGELAVALGMLGPTDVELIRLQQKHRDAPFGEIAVATGFLTPEQVQELLDYQRSSRRLMGQILVSYGYITEQQLSWALDVLSEVRDTRLEALLADTTDPLRRRFAETAVGVLQRIYRRLIDLPLEICRPIERSIATRQQTWRQQLSNGTSRYSIELHADWSSATYIAGRMLEMPLEEMEPDLTADAMGEFLNIVVGHVCGKIRPETEHVTAQPPAFVGVGTAPVEAMDYLCFSLDGAEIQMSVSVGVRVPHLSHLSPMTRQLSGDTGPRPEGPRVVDIAG